MKTLRRVATALGAVLCKLRLHDRGILLASPVPYIVIHTGKCTRCGTDLPHGR